MIKNLTAYIGSIILGLAIVGGSADLAMSGVLAAENASVHHWSDLDIVQQIQIITGVCCMILTIVVAITIFKSVWIRKGYEGIDEKLEAKEVATMLSHVIAFVCLLIFEYMIVFNPYMYNKFPDFAYWICASGFVGPEVYLLAQSIKGFVSGKKKEIVE